VVGAIERCLTELAQRSQAVSFDPAATGRFLLGLLLSGQGRIWIAEVDGQPVGLRVAQLQHAPFHPRTILATGIVWYVEPPHRGHGIGGQLVEVFEHWAQEQGATWLSVLPMASARSTRAFYSHRGYTLVEEHFIKGVPDVG